MRQLLQLSSGLLPKMMPILSRGIEGSINGLASAIIAIFTGAHLTFETTLNKQIALVTTILIKSNFKMVPIFSIEILISKIAITEWRGQEVPQSQ